MTGQQEGTWAVPLYERQNSSIRQKQPLNKLKCFSHSPSTNGNLAEPTIPKFPFKGQLRRGTANSTYSVCVTKTRAALTQGRVHRELINAFKHPSHAVT